MCLSPIPATYTAALERLAAFVPKAGRSYAANRNYDRPDGGHADVSGLSPYLRHRIVTEAEVLGAVLGRHSPDAAEKFIQEVFWRSYWKGWLELRPSVWADYRRALDDALAKAARDVDMASRIARAERGETGIACFDAWARELADKGYLHNHARMWAASIWIFTLRLPWEIGADWFLRHLLDGDPASNTLGWRWVAGLQTRGKAYAARAENIARFTDGRFAPHGALNETPTPLGGAAPPAPRAAPIGHEIAGGGRVGVLLTEDDLSPAELLARLSSPPVAHAALQATAGRSPGDVSPGVIAFAHSALNETRNRLSLRLGAQGPLSSDIADLTAWAVAENLDRVVVSYAPVGPTSTALRHLEAQLATHGIPLLRGVREWDRTAWPHATHGFFQFKKQIPNLLKRACG